MATLTGSSGGMWYENQYAARVKDFGVNMSRDAYEETCVGAENKTYTEGLFGATGTANLLIDPEDTGGRNFINAIRSRTGLKAIRMDLNSATGSILEFSAVITSCSFSVPSAGIQTVSMGFTISGAFTGGV